MTTIRSLPPGKAWSDALRRYNPSDPSHPKPPERSPSPTRHPGGQRPRVERDEPTRDFSRPGRIIAITALAAGVVGGGAIDKPAEGFGAAPAPANCQVPADLATRDGVRLELKVAGFTVAQQCEPGTTDDGVLIPPSQVTLAGVVDCDCGNVENGFLTEQYRKDCLNWEQGARVAAATEGLDLVAEEGTIVSGNAFCHSVASGPGAWPWLGGPPTPSSERGPPIPVCTAPNGSIDVCRD